MSSHFSRRTVQCRPLTKTDTAAVFKLTIRVSDDVVCLSQSFLDNCMKSVCATDRHVCQNRNVIDNAEYLVLPISDKDGGFRNLKDIVGTPEQKLGVYPIAVPQALPGISRTGDIRNYLYPPFFHTQGRHVLESNRLNAPDRSVQGAATPPGEARHHTGLEIHGIKTQYIHNHLKRPGIPQFQNGFTGLNHTLAFSNNSQNRAVYRGPDRHTFNRSIAVRTRGRHLKAGSGRCQLVGHHFFVKARGTQNGLGSGRSGPGLLQTLVGNKTIITERL